MTNPASEATPVHTPDPSGHGCPKCGAGISPDHADEVTEFGTVFGRWGGHFDKDTGVWEVDGNGMDMVWDAIDMEGYTCGVCDHEWTHPDRVPSRVVVQVRGGLVAGGYSVAGNDDRAPTVTVIDWDNHDDTELDADELPELPLGFSYTDDGEDIIAPPHAVAF